MKKQLLLSSLCALALATVSFGQTAVEKPSVPSITAPVVDKVKPVLVVGKFVKTTKAATVTLMGTAKDVSGIKEVRYRVGKEMVKLATGTTAWSFKADLKKGANKIQIFATDTKGNVSLTKVITIKLR